MSINNSLINEIPEEKSSQVNNDTNSNAKTGLKRKKKPGQIGSLITNSTQPLDDKFSEKPVPLSGPPKLPPQINGFIVNVQGMIESAQFFEGDAVYCKYDIVCGPDWKILNGQKSGQSQHACQGEGSSNYFVWNLPFELSLSSTNPSGWPQVVISCFCPDFFGREVLKAYGLARIPTTQGIHTRTLQMFSPVSSSVVVNAIGIFLGQKAEIINAPKVIATGEGREIMRSKSEGAMTVKFNVQLTNMEELGYNI